MEIIVLGSGSKGNATYIATKNTKILIDAGLSIIQINERLAKYNRSISNLDAVFITHEHTDHINSLASILARTNATLYIEEESFCEANKKLRNGLVYAKHVFIKADTRYQINDLNIVPISLSHDASNCFGYLVKEIDENNNYSYASVTDTGFIPTKYFKVLGTINTILIESNHDVDMLMNSARPWFLKNRILSDKGHLSNIQCTEYLKKFITEENKHIILGHISEECNDYDLCKKFLLKEYNDNPPFEVSVAYQYNPLPIIYLGDNHD